MSTAHVGSTPTSGTLNKTSLSYIIGIAIGDGGLSNPNGRAVRLRITCDTKYPAIIQRIQKHLHIIMPHNKISIVHRKDACKDISCYSNKWENILDWKAKNGPKHYQNITIPNWIKTNKKYSRHYLRELFETDGSIYKDRGYVMVNYTSIIKPLTLDIQKLIKILGFEANFYTHTNKNGNVKCTLRITKESTDFIAALRIRKN